MNTQDEQELINNIYSISLQIRALREALIKCKAISKKDLLKLELAISKKDLADQKKITEPKQKETLAKPEPRQDYMG